MEHTTVITDEDLKDNLGRRIQEIFNIRNQALLEEDKDILNSLYNRDVRTGEWAYEHELRKMKYLHQWAKKQGAEFKEINPQVVLRNIKEKDDRFTVTLLVSTEYKYVYEDSLETYNSFRTGTYHSLDLMSKEEALIITKEWYRIRFS